MSDFDWMNDIGQESDYDELPELPQRPEEEWLRQRLGMITGSQFGKLVKTAGDGFKLSTAKTADDLIYKLAWERLLKEGHISDGLGRMSFSSAATNHGNDFEPMAVLAYQESTGNEVQYTQSFVMFDSWIGGTPDGLVGDDGLIEIKCPYNGGNHLKSMLTGEVYDPEYMYQMQGYMWITGRQWCDFVTYDPDLIDELQLNVIRVDRDERIIAGIAEVMELVKARISSIMDEVEKRSLKN